jgi:hypothetical protein
VWRHSAGLQRRHVHSKRVIPFGAVGRVALRDAAPAIALRRIAMVQHGHFPERDPMSARSGVVTSGGRRGHCGFLLFDPEAVVKGRAASVRKRAWPHRTPSALPASRALRSGFLAPAPGAPAGHPSLVGLPTRARCAAGRRRARRMSRQGWRDGPGPEVPGAPAAGRHRLTSRRGELQVSVGAQFAGL